jgi:NitT/TauT family transport system substrate-binding protein
MGSPFKFSPLWGASLVLVLAACGGGAAPASSPVPAGSPPSSVAAKPAASAAAGAPASQTAKPAASASAAIVASPSTPASAGAAAKPAAKEPVKLEFMMPWILPTEYFYFLAADNKGYFKDEGIQIHLNEGSGSGNTVKVVGAGTTPIGLAEGSRVLGGRVGGIPIKAVMTLFYTSPVMVISLAEKPFKTLDSLLGKKLADSPESADTPIWKAAMVRKGLDPAKVNFVSVDPKAKTQLLLAGQVDAVLGESDAAQIEGTGRAVSTFNVTEDAGLQITADSVILNEDYLKKNPDMVKGFLRATLKGAAYAKEHPEEAIDMAQKVAPTFARKQIELQYKYEDSWIWSKYTPKDKFGCQSMEGWTNLQNLLADNKQIDKKIDLTQLVDNSYLPYQCS